MVRGFSCDSVEDHNSLAMMTRPITVEAKFNT